MIRLTDEDFAELFTTMCNIKIRQYESIGGPKQAHWVKIPEYIDLLIHHGDAAFIHEKKYTACAVEALLNAVALLSFVPGGVTAWGHHFESKAAKPKKRRRSKR